MTALERLKIQLETLSEGTDGATSKLCSCLLEYLESDGTEIKGFKEK